MTPIRPINKTSITAPDNRGVEQEPLIIDGSDIDYRDNFLPIKSKLQALVNQKTKLQITYGDKELEALSLKSFSFKAHSFPLNSNDKEENWKSTGRYGTIELIFQTEEGTEIKLSDFGWKSLELIPLPTAHP